MRVSAKPPRRPGRVHRAGWTPNLWTSAPGVSAGESWQDPVIGDIEQVVVVGAGLAGLRAIEELRGRDYPGQITLVGAEDRPPYDRPPLSKKLMTGELDDTSLRADFGALGVDFRPGETATGLEPGTGSGGLLRTGRAEYRFDRLILATGATPVTLPGPGPQRVLRTLDDALAIRAALRPGTKLVVAGAGWVGAELATAAASLGAVVTVLDAADAPLSAGVRGRRPGWTCCSARLSSRCSRAGSRWPAAAGWRPTRWSPRSASGRRPAGWRARTSGCRRAWPPTRACAAPCPACSRRGTARRSSPAGTAGGSGSSTGTSRCTGPRSPRPTCSAAARSTTRCRTSGPSSSARCCSTSAITAPPTE